MSIIVVLWKTREGFYMTQSMYRDLKREDLILRMAKSYIFGKYNYDTLAIKYGIAPSTVCKYFRDRLPSISPALNIIVKRKIIRNQLRGRNKGLAIMIQKKTKGK